MAEEKKNPSVEKLKALQLAMEKIDNENSNTYKENADTYIAQIKDVDSKIQNIVDKVKMINLEGCMFDLKTILEYYDSIFIDDASIYMRTDNQGLYIYSLMSFSEHGYVLSDITFDLHSQNVEDLITTEYEDKFSNKGMPIYSVVATKSVQKSK